MHNELTSRPHSYSPGYQEGKEFEEKNTEEKKQVEVLYYSVGMESWEEMNKKNKSGKKKSEKAFGVKREALEKTRTECHETVPQVQKVFPKPQNHCLD